MNEPVPVKPAATVMLIRNRLDGAPGLDVFMMRRSSTAAFASGMLVFPGGKVDAADGDGDDAYVVAAIREAFEEAGVLLARDADGAIVDGAHPARAHRHEVHEGALPFAELCDRFQLTPCVSELPWVSRWITPLGEVGARRFDTRFFLAHAPDDHELTHDNKETVDSLWVSTDEAIRRFDAGEWLLMPPTIANVRFLHEHATVDDAMVAARRIGTPPAILPKIRYDADGTRIAGVVLPGDAGYDEL